jgi:hypothetical protein
VSRYLWEDVAMEGATWHRPYDSDALEAEAEAEVATGCSQLLLVDQVDESGEIAV